MNLLVHITRSTGMRNYCKIWFDNIFSNTLIENAISDNPIAAISDHLPDVFVLPNIFPNPPFNKSNIYEKGWSNIVQENFILVYFSVD